VRWLAHARQPLKTQSGSCLSLYYPNRISMPAYTYSCLLLKTVLHQMTSLLLHAHSSQRVPQRLLKTPAGLSLWLHPCSRCAD
jgi:hypothetical protein